VARARDGGLRVAFDAAPAHHDPTGVGVYVRDLAMALLARDPDSIALIGVRPDGPLAVAAAGAPKSTFLRGGRHQRWLMTRARSDAAAVDSDLVHFTNAAAPLRPGRPYVLTIQDLSLFRYPRYHPPLRVAAAPLIAIAVRRATAIIVPSEATRSEIRRLLHVSGRRVVVVPHAASTHIPGGPADPANLASARAELGLGGDPYILSVSTLEPRKNHARLVQAFERLVARQPSIRLVLVGGPGWLGRSLRESVLASPVADRIHVAGYVSQERLAALMAGATVFSYVSLYEGFGLPILDAMRAGVPVVTSATSSMPEVAGGAAVLVDPYDPVAIATGLDEAIRRHTDLVAAGALRAGARCWGDVAAETWDVYRWAARHE
jgi:glycosyltransferase involved in cell wall biosynthesis